MGDIAWIFAYLKDKPLRKNEWAIMLALKYSKSRGKCEKEDS